MPTAAYYLNRVRSPASYLNITPLEAMFGIRPDATHMRVFGSPVFAIQPVKSKRDAIGKVASIGVFVGYDESTAGGYKVYDPVTKHVCQVRSGQVYYSAELSTISTLNPKPLSPYYQLLPPLSSRPHGCEPAPLQGGRVPSG